jgi:hypothetical protein
MTPSARVDYDDSAKAAEAMMLASWVLRKRLNHQLD